jgi:AcrR family transcriptional regulator
MPKKTSKVAPPKGKAEQILEEATLLIGDRGYHGFGIHELAQRCGLSNPGLLYHFGSKDKLLIALLQYRINRDTAAGALKEGGNNELPKTLNEVRGILRSLVSRHTTQPEIVRFYAVLRAEAMNKGHPAHDLFLSREQETIKRLALAVAPHVSHPDSTARQLLALLVGLEDQWLREGQTFDVLSEWDRGIAKILP